MGDKRNPPLVLQDWRGEQLLLWELYLYHTLKRGKGLDLFEGEVTPLHPKVQVHSILATVARDKANTI